MKLSVCFNHSLWTDRLYYDALRNLRNATTTRTVNDADNLRSIC